MDKKQDEAREKMQEVTRILLIIHLFRKNYLYGDVFSFTKILTKVLFRSKCRCRNSKLPPTKAMSNNI